MLQRVIFALFLFFPSVVFAGGGPGDLVLEMISKLKETRQASVILEYIHWGKAFESFPARDKARIRVNSPEEMKDYFETFFRDPGSFLKREMEQQLTSLDPAQADMARANMERMVKTVEQKQLEMQQKMSEAEYSLGEVSVQGNAATVELISQLDGEKKSRKLPLEKVDGRWYLPGMTFIQEKQTS